MKKSPELIKFIREQAEQLSNLKTRERNNVIRERVKEEFNWILLEADDIYKLVSRKVWHFKEDLCDTKKGLDRLWELFQDDEQEIKEKNWKKYLILRIKQEEVETWETYEEPVAISMDTIDSIYNDYVHHGQNMSWQAICDKYGIPWKAWGHLKNRLNLNKNQNIVSDITLQPLEWEDLDDKIDEMVWTHIFNRHKKLLKTAYDKHIKKLLDRYSTNETWLLHLQDFLTKHYEPRKVVFPKIKIENNDIRTFDFWDIHFWKIHTDHILTRLSIMKDDIIKSKERIIYLKCFGDIIEAFAQEWMHKWQVAYWMESTYGYGFELLMFAVNTLEQFLEDLYTAWKEVHFIWVPWNHDRLTDDKEKDIKKSWWMIIYEMIKRWLSKTKIDIDYMKENVYTVDIWNVRYIIAHGDWVFDKQSPEKIIVLYWDSSKYNVIISADKHHFSMKEWIKYLWIKTPALAWKWQYDDSMFLWSEPWYITFKDNQWWTTWFSLNRLPNDKSLSNR